MKELVKALIEKHKEEMAAALSKMLGGGTLPIDAIARYTLAFAGPFTDLLGKTGPWVRHERARYAISDNLRCEQSEDHVGMLFEFADACGVTFTHEHHRAIAQEMQALRNLMRNVNTAGLSGLTVLTLLENISEVFIPELERAAVALSVANLTYTQVHGVADQEHSNAFTIALEAELGCGYDQPEKLVQQAAEVTMNLLHAVFGTR
ncbi:MAG: iron-containing redox enzyme family protein [Candidatus Buchananbacteria bacterium]|nr:iron-containing redox enzyme family protein [Candidatus Buchananbacteria bacterium]